MKKKVLCFTLAVIMCIGLLSSSMVMTVSAKAMIKADAMKWCDDKKGTYVGNHQCVALTRKYCIDLFGYTVNSNACNYAKEKKFPADWLRLPYTDETKKNYEVKPGDIAVWTYNKINDEENFYGHVGIIKEATSNGFKCYEQNPYKVKVTTYTYEKKNWTFWGVIRPPFEDEIETIKTEESSKKTSSTITDKALNDINKAIKNAEEVLKDYTPIADGIYKITNVASGKALGVTTNSTTAKPKHHQKVGMWTYNAKDPASKWTLQIDNKDYIIHSGTKNIVLNANSNVPESSTKVNVFKYKDDEYVDTQKWIIESIGNEQYIIRLKSNTNIVLTANSKNEGAGVVVKTYDPKSDYQKWTFKKV